ncbi:MAG: HypC/HybG/HupF family hydrogenase formation chaperone [Patescibacteria group bacterium]
MCLTIPKKVVSISNGKAVLENPDGSRQEAGSLLELNEGDFVFAQGGVVIQKISSKEAQEILGLLGTVKK